MKITVDTLNNEAMSYISRHQSQSSTKGKPTDTPDTPDTPDAPQVPDFDAGLSQFKKETKTDEKEQKQAATGVYTDAEKADNIAWAKNVSNNVIDMWMNNRGYIDPNYNKDLAKNPPNGRLNNADFNSTLDALRQADAINNRLWWQGEDIGARTNSGFGSSGIGIGKGIKYEPITTEEMRQMQSDRAIYNEARRRDISRQADVKDYSLELQKNADKLTTALAQHTGISDIDFNRAVQQAVFDTRYTQPNRSYLSTITQNTIQRLALQNKNEIFKLAASLYNIDPVWADNYISNMLNGGSLPSLEDTIDSKIFSAIYKLAGKNPIKAKELMQSLTSMLATISVNGMVQMANMFVPGNNNDK